MVHDFETLVSEGLQIVDLAEKRGATLRLMGGVAIRIHTRNNQGLYKRLGRTPGDLDFVGYKKESGLLKQLMTSSGYAPHEMFNAMHGHKRQLWYSKQYQIDILLDTFEMCHVLDMRDRLKLDRPTITLSDLFLQKIQIAKINEKDIKDLLILLVEHDLGDSDDDKINLAYVSDLLTRDWGFWYTTQTNLKKLMEHVVKYNSLTAQEQELVLLRARSIGDRLDRAPKSFRWRMRERMGTKASWYKDVEEVDR